MSSHVRTVRYVISYFLAFVLSLSLVVAALSGIAVATIGRPAFLISCLNKSGYYIRTAAEIEGYYYEINGLPGGMPEEVFSGAVEQLTLRSNVETAVQAAYRGEDYVLNRSSLQAELYQRFVDYAVSHDYTLTEEVRRNLQNMAEYCINDYQQHMLNPYLLQAIRYISPFIGYLPYLLAGSLLLSFLLAVFLYAIRLYKHRAVRLMQYSLCGAGCMLVVVPAVILCSGIIGRLALTSQSLYGLATVYLTSLLTSCLYTGLALIVVATTVVMLLYRLLKHRVS